VKLDELKRTAAQVGAAIKALNGRPNDSDYDAALQAAEPVAALAKLALIPIQREVFKIAQARLAALIAEQERLEAGKAGILRGRLNNLLVEAGPLTWEMESNEAVYQVPEAAIRAAAQLTEQDPKRALKEFKRLGGVNTPALIKRAVNLFRPL
jgi:hypothetical protein